MFLKNYSGHSDKKLIEQLNGNIHYQIFCNLVLEPGELITNYKIVSQIRCELAARLDIEKSEKVLFKSWKGQMNNLDSITCDATCYESSIKYPTDVKLLYDSVEWIYNEVSMICKEHKRRKPRTKIRKWRARAISFSKMKKKRKNKRRSLTRGLLRLLSKLIGIIEELEKDYGPRKLTKRYLRRIKTIKQILLQQEAKFYEGIGPNNAIVSIEKPYIRPIVRCKEKNLLNLDPKFISCKLMGLVS